MTRYDILGREWKTECIGCAIGSGEMLPPGGYISESKHFYLHQDPEIPIMGFLVITSKKHYRSIVEIEKEELIDLANILYEGRLLLNRLNIADITIIQEERSGHFHVWLFPWLNWMVEKWDKKSIAYIREIMNFARENMKTEGNIKEIMHAIEILKVENKRS